jgi:sigma-B regulation protein RsbU (phosphoserine phosphatase)
LCEQKPDTAKDALVEDLNDLYENAPCGYLSLGPDGVVVKANLTLCGWLGVTAYDLLGKRFHDLLTVPGKIFYETHFAPMLRMQGHFNEVALDLVTAQGGKMAVLANAHERRSADGRLLFTRITLFQAEERRRYERDLVEARNKAERIQHELQTLNTTLERRIAEGVAERTRLLRGLRAEQEVARLREQFVAILGHDLRNPLSSIVGGLNVLSREMHTEKADKIMSLMRGSTDRMFSLINDMLDFARLKSGAGILVQLAEVDLEPVLEQVIDELRTSRPGRSIESRISLPDAIRCDPARIAQLLSNLLANALTHGESDGPVLVDASATADQMTIAVSNAGEPIPEDVQGRLFQPFFRAGATSGNQGLGLGLYIAGEIARSHGGELGVASNASATTFFFRMRLAA